LINIGEISKPSGGVTPLKSKTQAKSANPIDAPEQVTASNKVSEKKSQADQNEAQQHKKANKQANNKSTDKLTKKDTTKKSEVDNIPADETYDESGHKARRNQIDIKV
jgi:hypothetical protein